MTSTDDLRANLATAESQAEREAVLDHYMEILARIHKLDLADFQAMGMKRPETSEQLGLCDLDVWERAYRKDKRRPEPAIEFLIRWVRGRVPEGRSRVSFICGDSGQFLFDQGRVTALIDLELASLGDPVADLGALPGRDLSEPLGDLSRGVRKYEEHMGETVDRAVLDFHTVRFSLVTPLAVSRLVAEPPPGIDLVQYLAWYLVWTRGPLEVIAAQMGLHLEPPELPESDDASPGSSPNQSSPGVPKSPETDDASSPGVHPGFPKSQVGQTFDAYEQDRLDRIATYEERRARLGPPLEALVAEADPERDSELIGYLWRRILREEAILKPVMRELRNAKMQIIR